MYFPVPKEFTPIPRVKYSMVFDGKDEPMTVVFTEQNKLSNDEKYMGFYRHECHDIQSKRRYVCYISECYCEKDLMVIYMKLDGTKPNIGVTKIYRDQEEVYHLE